MKSIKKYALNLKNLNNKVAPKKNKSIANKIHIIASQPSEGVANNIITSKNKQIIKSIQNLVQSKT